jgi:hypothetical protein
MPEIPSRKNYVRVFETFGVAFSKNGCGDERIAEACPWCGKDKFI